MAETQTHLMLPSAALEESYRSYIRELGDEERYPFPLDFDHSDFAAMLRKLNDFQQGVNIPEGFVPSTTYWLIINDELIGVTNIRHYLNERIRHASGHIGLGIRPTARGQGFGHLLMQRSIEKAHALGINPVHIHCYNDNLASAQTIIGNGGVLDSEIEDGGKVVQRYLVNLDKVALRGSK